MKLLSIRMAFIQLRKTWNVEFNLGRLDSCEKHRGDNESDLLLKLTSFKGIQSNT